MKDGHIDDFDLERIVKAVQEDMEVIPIERPEVIVKNEDSDSDDSHVVNLDDLHCTCSDYTYNCESEAKKTDQPRYCKHLYCVVFKRAGML
jgi:hypothetical protein